MQEFEALIERTHQNKLKAIIDFVPNHVARQYRSDAKPDGIMDLGSRDNTAHAFDTHNNFPGISFQDKNFPAFRYRRRSDPVQRISCQSNRERLFFPLTGTKRLV